MSSQKSSSGLRRMAGHGSIYAVGNIMRQLVGFLMLPVYTRYLTPADYGVVGLMTFAVSLIELFFGARLSQAVPKYYFDFKDKRKQARVVSTAMIITSIVSAVTAVAVILFRDQSSLGIFGSPEYASIVGLFAVLIFTQAQEYYALTYIRLQQRPWLFVSVNLIKLVLQLSLNIWLVVYMEMGVMGVAISAMISSTLFAIILISYTVRYVGFGFDISLGKKMVLFCWPLWLAGFANLYIGSSNRYYIRVFASLDEVGLYELAAKFGVVIGFLVWDSFAQYWQVERFRYFERGNAEPIFQSVFSFISTVLMLTALGIAIFAGPVIRVMADISFSSAAKAVPFLAFASVFSCFVMYFNFSFHVKEQTGWISKNSYLTAIMVTVFYLIFIPQAGFVGAAIAIMLAQGIQFVFVYHASRHFYDMGISLKPLGLMFFISVLAIWLANLQLSRVVLWEDLLMKVIVYSFSCIIIVFPLWRNKEVRRSVIEFMPRVRTKYLNMK